MHRSVSLIALCSSVTPFSLREPIYNTRSFSIESVSDLSEDFAIKIYLICL